MKNTKRLIILGALLSMSLTACGGNGGGGGGSIPKLVIEDYGTVKLEAEDFEVSNWEPEGSYNGEKIITEANASGGKYLAAAEFGMGAEARFSFELKKDSRVVISAAYAQMAANIGTAIDMSKVYEYGIEGVTSPSFAPGKSTLNARASATVWQEMPYLYQDLNAGVYSVRLTVKASATVCPSIDYIQFETSDPAAEVPVDPSTLTEDDIPDNDFRNLQQYKYLQDKNVKSYKTYGSTSSSQNYSAPRGMKLRFEELSGASKYYVQVAESEAGLSTAAVREATTNYYMFQNAKLATKYYYKAATSEAGLSSATVKNITSTDVAPRVVNVPNVLNFRDIGGWNSSLVQGAKIKQGLYFRCAQLNQSGYSSTRSELDSAGLGLAAIKELGIKVDIDMRDIENVPTTGSPANTTNWPVSLLDAHVPSSSEPVRWEGGTYKNQRSQDGNTNIAEQYVKIFNTLANCDTAPALLHCTYGADRTGIVTFFLEALLGMSEEDMTRDYLWTQFTPGRNVKIEESDGAEFPQWLSKTKALQGDTLADKMENHLESFGIAHNTLEHIREIFVPGYVAK